MDLPRPIRRLLIALAVLVGLGVVALATSQIDQLIALLEWVRTAGPKGWLAFAVVYLFASLLMAPASFLQGSAGFLLGPIWGFVAASLMSVGSGMISFILARTVLRDVVAARVQRDPSFHAIDGAIGDGGAYLVGLLRLSPLSPFNVMNYALGLTKVTPLQYLAGTWLGSIPAVLLYSYVGSTVSSLTELAEGGAARDFTPQLVILGCTLVATVLVARYAQQALKRALAAAPEPSR